MALLINAADPLGSANANTTDNNLRTLKTAIEDIFGVPDNTTIGVEGFTFNSGGLRRLRFQDAAGDPGTAGFLQRNATLLKWHDATAARTIYTAGGTDVAVADGGTGISSGTSGGILAFTGSTTLASSALLTQRGLVFGGGAGVAPGSMSALTNGQLPVGRTSNSPTGATITAGANAAVTNGSGSISVAATDRVVVQLAGQFVTDSISRTYYIGARSLAGVVGSSAGEVAFPSPVTGTVTGLYLRAIANAGADINFLCAVNVGGSDGLSVNIGPVSDTEKNASNASSTIAVSAGSALTVKAIGNGTGSSDQIWFRATVVIQPAA